MFLKISIVEKFKYTKQSEKFMEFCKDLFQRLTKVLFAIRTAKEQSIHEGLRIKE
jgi:hypothetical protein